jgi:hypothetical protein
MLTNAKCQGPGTRVARLEISKQVYDRLFHPPANTAGSRNEDVRTMEKV